MHNAEIDTAAAEAYEQHLVSRLFGPWAEQVVGLAAPKPGEAILDVACGTGIGARLAAVEAGPGGRVVGTDSDAGMIKVARRLSAAAGLSIEWQVVAAENLPFSGGEFDLCLCLQGPNFLSNPAEGLARMRRILKPSGRLVASMWCAMEHNKGHYAIAQALERHGIAPALRPFSMGDPAWAERLISEAGFRKTELQTREKRIAFPSAEAFISGVAAGAPATRHAIAELPDDKRGEFVADVAEILKPYETDNGLSLPTRCHIVAATA